MQESPDQLDRLEKKVDFLTWVVSVQAVLIGVIAARYLLQAAGRLLLVVIVIAPILYVFRRSLPGWGRNLGQMLGKAERMFRQKTGGSSM